MAERERRERETERESKWKERGKSENQNVAYPENNSCVKMALLCCISQRLVAICF